MLSLLPWDSGHVRWLPCEDIPILPDEGGERAFLCRVEAGPNHGSLVLTRVGGLKTSVDREDTLRSWHLQQKIRVVGYHHELGEGGSSQDGVVGGLKLGDLGVDVLGAEVVAGAEGDRQSGTADWSRPGC